MLNKKRLKNLLLIKQKKLVNQKLEITTLDNEFKKNFDNRTKLKSILQNTSIKSFENVRNYSEKSKFKLKLTEQIFISENREKFLNIELQRAKKNLGKLIKEKELVDEKIKDLIKCEKSFLEKKFNDMMPPRKNS